MKHSDSHADVRARMASVIRDSSKCQKESLATEGDQDESNPKVTASIVSWRAAVRVSRTVAAAYKCQNLKSVGPFSKLAEATRWPGRSRATPPGAGCSRGARRGPRLLRANHISHTANPT